MMTEKQSTIIQKPLCIVLIREEPEDALNRWYVACVQPTLLEPVAVTCLWGSRENSYQQIQVHSVSDWAEACDLAQTIVNKKRQKGYRRVE